MPNVTNAVNKGYSVDLVMLDFAKAFISILTRSVFNY